MIEKILRIGSKGIVCPFCNQERVVKGEPYLDSYLTYSCSSCNSTWYEIPYREIELNLKHLPNGLISGYCDACSYFNPSRTWSFGEVEQGKCKVNGNLIPKNYHANLYLIPKECQLKSYSNDTEE